MPLGVPLGGAEVEVESAAVVEADPLDDEHAAKSSTVATSGRSVFGTALPFSSRRRQSATRGASVHSSIGQVVRALKQVRSGCRRRRSAGWTAGREQPGGEEVVEPAVGDGLGQRDEVLGG